MVAVRRLEGTRAGADIGEPHYVRLGSLSELIANADRPDQPLLATEVLGVALLRGPGERLHAVPRRCPHKDSDMVAYGEWVAPGSGDLRCRHRGYRWCGSTGELLAAGNTGPAADMRLADVVIDDDGIAWMSVRDTSREG